MDIDDILDDFAGTSAAKQQQPLYEQLVTAMLNERMAPDLLPYQHALLASVLGQLQDQQQYLLDLHEYGDTNMESGVVSGDFKLQLMIIETDIERLNYLVRLYLRTRLAKLDQFAIHYINETAEEAEAASGRRQPLLSREETAYMHRHFQILTQLYNNLFLKKLPHFLTLLDDTRGGQSMVTKPDVDQPVFIRVVTATPILVPLGGEDDELELVQDGIYVVRYRLVRRYVEIGDVVLI